MNDKQFLDIMDELKEINTNIQDNIYIYFGYEDKYLLVLDKKDIFVSFQGVSYFDYAISDIDEMMESIIEDWDYILETIQKEITLQEQVSFIYYE